MKKPVSRRRALAARIVCGACILVAAFISGGSAAPKVERASGEGIIRLHVVANSDSDYDQRVKLVVRDAVRDACAELFADCDSPGRAFEVAEASLSTLTDAARTAAVDAGFDGNVRAVLGDFALPDKVYGGSLFPTDTYSTLRIELGGASGHNWWCVIFPGLCLPAPDADGEVQAILRAPDYAAPITFRSAIYDWVCGLFGNGSE